MRMAESSTGVTRKAAPFGCWQRPTKMEARTLVRDAMRLALKELIETEAICTGRHERGESELDRNRAADVRQQVLECHADPSSADFTAS